MTILELYRSLEFQLIRVRLNNNNNLKSKEEEELVDSMDSVWYNLTEEEQKMLCLERKNKK